MATNKVPYVPSALVDYLETLYRDRCPRPDASNREIWMDVGSVRVVRKLRQMAEDQLKPST